jgi:hypothetical protein
MNVVIQCAAGKRSNAGHMRRSDGTPVMFVADPGGAPQVSGVAFARPDDIAEDGRSWRDHLLDYNRSPGINPLNLLPAFELYENPAYTRLAARFGVDRLFILSAGWGLIPAKFLTPAYDITFSQSADSYKRRRKSDVYRDFRHFPSDSPDVMVFLGGKDYVPLFSSLTAGAKARRVVFFNSTTATEAPGCTVQRYATTTRTNWHYECAQALIDGRIAVAGRAA